MATHLKLLRNAALLENEPDSRNAGVGNICVPAKPSLDMLTAGSSAGGVSVQKAWEIYMAMLRSTPPEPR